MYLVLMTHPLETVRTGAAAIHILRRYLSRRSDGNRPTKIRLVANDDEAKHGCNAARETARHGRRQAVTA